MTELGQVREVHNALEKDPARIHEGLWMAMVRGNRFARMQEMPDFENIVTDIHSCVMRPVVDPQFRYLLEDYRTRDALVLGGIVHPTRWRDLPQAMHDYSDVIREGVAATKSKRFPAVSDFIDLASFAHYQFYKIHPFLDGHKRTARQLVDILAKHLKFRTILITIDHKKEYMDAIEASTKARDIRYFSIFQAGLVADAYRGRKDPRCKYCFDAAIGYRASLLSEVRKKPQVVGVMMKSEPNLAIDVSKL